MKKLLLTVMDRSKNEPLAIGVYSDIKSAKEGLFNAFKDEVDLLLPEEKVNDRFWCSLTFPFGIREIEFGED